MLLWGLLLDRIYWILRISFFHHFPDESDESQSAFGGGSFLPQLNPLRSHLREFHPSTICRTYRAAAVKVYWVC